MRRHPGSRDLAAIELLQRTAVVANEAATFSDAVTATLDEVCRYTGWPVGHAYVVERGPGHEAELAPTSLWHLEHPRRYDVFREITETFPLRTGIGLPGRVLESGRPEWSFDVTHDANFPRAHTGRDINVHGAFAMPVMSGRTVIAVLEFFSDEPQQRDEDLLELMGHVGTQLGRVAERERAAVALVDQVEYTRHLIDSAYDAFVSIDQLGRITGWNRAAETMFGWSSGDVMGLPLVATIIPKRYRERHLAGFARFLATGESTVLNQRLELSAVDVTGREFPIELAIWDAGSKDSTRFCAFIHDITERVGMIAGLKAADERSRQSEQRLVAAQEMAGVGSWEWDIESNVVTCSDQLYRNFGVERGDFEPSFQGHMSLVHPDDRAFVSAQVTDALDKLGSFEFEHRSIDPANGDERIHHCTGRVIVEDGRAVHMAGTNQDVTEQRRIERAITEAYEREHEMVSRLKELDAAKTRFVSSVSHELRTPLTSIIGYLQMLQLTARELTDDHREMIDVIDRNSQRLLSLIEDLLTQSRVESGSFKLTLEPTAIEPIVVQAVQSMLPTAVERDIAIDVSIDPDVGDVMGDAVQIERLLLNLLTNAMKFTSRGSVRVAVVRSGRSVVMTVTDTGIGIPNDEIQRLFSPFFRSSNAEQTASGTGLGLVIVKAIVDGHNGTIDIDSAPDMGTTVTVTLPAAESPESAE